MQQLAQERLLIGITSVAAMEMAVGETVRYTKDRSAFGREVFVPEHPLHVGRGRDGGPGVPGVPRRLHHQAPRRDLDIPTVAKLNWWTGERAMRVIDECVQLHGGYRDMSEYRIARAWTDQRVQKIYGGTNEIMKAIISRTL